MSWASPAFQQLDKGERLGRASGREVAKVKGRKAAGYGVGSQEKVMYQGHEDREMPIGFDHVELVGDLDKSNVSGVEAHLRTVGRGEGLPT